MDIQAIKDKVAEALKELAAPYVEVQLEKIVNEKYDAEFDKAVEALKAQIPSEQVDALVAIIAAHFKPTLKAGLLAKIEQISDKV